MQLNRVKTITFEIIAGIQLKFYWKTKENINALSIEKNNNMIVPIERKYVNNDSYAYYARDQNNVLYKCSTIV